MARLSLLAATSGAVLIDSFAALKRMKLPEMVIDGARAEAPDMKVSATLQI
jgi:hypothetical protein